MNMTHADLCERARRWLTGSAGCPIALVEFVVSLSEIPDAIGFRKSGRDSIVIECKASRSDFLRDAHKPHRKADAKALGDYRYYMCEPDVIGPDDLPDRWGLLWVVGTKVKRMTGADPKRTYWPPENDVWRFPTFDGERVVMFSALRRLQLRLGTPAFREKVQTTFSDMAATP